MTQTQAPFLLGSVNPGDWSQLEPLYKQLQDRPIESTGDLESWLADLAQLEAVVDEHGTRLHLDHARHTDDPKIEEAYLRFVREVQPKLQPVFFELQKKYLAAATRFRGRLSGPVHRMLSRNWAADVELFRQKNVPLFTNVTELVTQYNKICGAMTVEFRGQTYTLQQMARFQEEPDRPTRQEAWELSTARRLADREQIETIYDQLFGLRQKIAVNAGFDDFRGYKWKSSYRFDYSPQDCLRFGDAIEKACMPLVRELDRQRAADLGLTKLRPWDAAVDPKNRPPLRPFAPEDIAGFVARTGDIFSRISPVLAEQFGRLLPDQNLDLDSRKGKRPGGFQSSLEVQKQPFIFMNAAGLQGDIETLLHEAGHAFHYLESAPAQMIYVRSAPLEFCEVASMSMELLGQHHYDVFYSDASGGAARARRRQLEGIIRILTWIATIDGFQHWLYSHLAHTHEQRQSAWLALLDRFSSGMTDWSGYEEARAFMWQRQIHLFAYPFYYIEYGIAQLGALQVWLNYRRDPDKALAQLRHAFALGGSAPLPELFEAAGIRFDFSAATLEPLMAALGEEIAKLPR